VIHQKSTSVRIPNTYGLRPRTFEIDILIENRDALEVKRRDAAWDYVKQYTTIDLKSILQSIAGENVIKWRKLEL
jgi:hypothetical protein